MFKDREEAARELADKLADLKNEKDLIVLGVPRGGVVLAKIIAEKIGAPYDIVVTRKIGHPLNPEFAIAAVDADGEVTTGALGADIGFEYGGYIEEKVKEEKEEIRRRLKEFRGVETHPDIKNKICVLVDDGIATGLTLLSAIRYLRTNEVREVIAAVPVLPKELIKTFEEESDKLIFLESPEVFFAVGQFYEDFPQVSDEEVKRLLAK